MDSMMRDFAYFCRTSIPYFPPFVILVALFMMLCACLWYLTKCKGYLITFWSGFLYMVPWLLQCVLR